MKKLMAAIAVVVALAFGATLVAEAEQCPLLIKELKERMAKLPDHDYKKGIMGRMIAEAQKLHEEGKHAEAVKMCQDATVFVGH